MEEEVEKWNVLAKRYNIKNFIQVCGRQPENYEEVRQWVRKLIERAEICVNKPIVQVVNIGDEEIKIRCYK